MNLDSKLTLVKLPSEHNVEFSELPELSRKSSKKKSISKDTHKAANSLDMAGLIDSSTIYPQHFTAAPSMAVTSAQGTSALYCMSKTPLAKSPKT